MFTAQSALNHYSTLRGSFNPFAVRRSALAKRQFNRRSLDVDFARTRAYILLRARLDWSTRVIPLLFYNTCACAWQFEILLHYTSLSWASLLILLSLTYDWRCMHGMRGNDDENLSLIMRGGPLSSYDIQTTFVRASRFICGLAIEIYCC